MAKKELTIFYIESAGYWHLVKANEKNEAWKDAVREYGRDYVEIVRPATEGEIKSYLIQKGTISEAIFY